MTLIESVTAMVLMVFILTSASVFVNSTNTNKQNIRNIAEATQVGNDLIESLRATEYDSLNTSESHSVLNNDYKCSWSISDSGSYKIVKVDISWPVQSPIHNIDLQTIIAK